MYLSFALLELQLTISISQLLSHVLKYTINITNFLCIPNTRKRFPAHFQDCCQTQEKIKTSFQEMLFLENNSNCLNFLQFFLGNKKRWRLVNTWCRWSAIFSRSLRAWGFFSLRFRFLELDETLDSWHAGLESKKRG